ncbi:unnamed protein product [Rotaria sp. Silwood2]|nr:unnamed protein product [Rotaria sp. Silwood2]CAF4649610.1 unnamed protein product [Rotaria sp. Silwood2]
MNTILDENISRNYYTGIMTVLSNPNIKDVYQINAPLDFYLLAIHGCIFILCEEHHLTNLFSNLYQFNKLEFFDII